MTATSHHETAPRAHPPTGDEYADLLASLGQVVVCVDLDGRATYLGPGWRELTGLEPEDCMGRTMEHLFGDETVRPTPEAHRRLLESGGTAVSVEVSVIDHDGSGRVFRCVQHVRRDERGAAVGVVAAVADVTAERHAELAVRENQKLESVGRLAAGIAHEINTPIQFIGDNLYFLSESFERVTALLDRYRSALDGRSGQLSWAERQEMLRSAEDVADMEFVVVEVPEAVEAALGGVKRVASIVRAMKAFGHPDRAEGQPVDINEIVRNTLVVARNEMKYVANVDAHYGDLPIVIGQPGDLGQVFLNLFVNAADAIRDAVGSSGDIGAIEVTTASQGDAVTVTVRDTGAGIPPEAAPHVFEPFFTTKEVGRGTGQGLSLSRAIVERHGGELSFRAAPEGGTIFTVLLPCGREAE